MVAVEARAQRPRLVGIATAGVGGDALVPRGEGPLARLAQRREPVVLEEAGLAERGHELLRDVGDLDRPGKAGEPRAQIVLVVGAVEEGQAPRQEWRHDQGGVRVAKRIAHQQPRLLGERRGHDVEVGT